MISPRVRVLVLVITLVAVGWAGVVHAAKAFRAAGFTGVSDARVVVMRIEARLYDVGAGGGLVERPEWSATARAHLARGLQAELTGRRMVAVPFRPSEEPVRRALSIQLARLHDVVVEEILEHQVGSERPLPTKAGRFEWTIGSDAAVIRDDHGGAEFALWLSIGDAYSTSGRQAANVAAAIFGGTVMSGRQFGVLSIVRLATGEIVYFARRAVTGGSAADLRTAAGAGHAVGDLLEDLPR